MSTVSPNRKTTGFWGKVKTSTKSLSSSLSHLTARTETDGDTEESTIVHKALVKFYESQEPFRGFPGWLGEKENLPDEQKILKKQSQQATKSNTASGNNEQSGKSTISKLSSGFGGLRLSSSAKSGSEPPVSPERRTTAGMAFHNIYSKSSPGVSPSNSPEAMSSRLSSESSPSRKLGNALGAGYSRSTGSTTPLSQSNDAPVLVRNPSQLMTERLRGRR